MLYGIGSHELALLLEIYLVSFSCHYTTIQLDYQLVNGNAGHRYGDRLLVYICVCM